MPVTSSVKNQGKHTRQPRTLSRAEQVAALQCDFPDFFRPDEESMAALGDHFVSGLEAAVERHGDDLRVLLMRVLTSGRTKG